MDDLFDDLACVKELNRLVDHYGPPRAESQPSPDRDRNNPNKKAEKVVTCKYWMRGLCAKGEDCPFLHEMDPDKMVREGELGLIEVSVARLC